MTVGKDDKLNSQVIATFKQYIQDHLKDSEFQSLFLNFFEEDYSQRIFTAHHRTSIHKYFEQFLIAMFENYTIQRISWKQYCLSMKCIRIRDWDKRTKRIARQLLAYLYHYITENSCSVTEGIIEIKAHKKFLIFEERKFPETSEYWLDRFSTNFPLDSSPEQLHLIPGDNKRDSTILNLNVFTGEIQNLILGYYQSEISSKQHNGLRQFIYLFRYSLLTVEKELRSIDDFTFEVFKKQYRFYQKANMINTVASMNFSFYLIRFYLYLCRIIKEKNIQHNIFEGTHYNENVLANNLFGSFYEKGYRLLIHNHFEEIPFENRWQLITSDGYANMVKNKPRGIDFTEVKDKYLREDLKTYIWKQSNMSVNTVAIMHHILIEFLNFISDYKQLNKLKENDYVDLDVVEQWNFYIGSKKIGTRNNYSKACKSYLKFYKDKYQIPQLIIESFTKTPQDNNGGNPMTKHDLNLFSKKFQEQRTQGIIGELCYIIFNLAVTTKLRFGEILSLERDCIVEKHEQVGVIQYYSKVTGNQKVKLTLAIEKVNLIEKAIRLTEDAHSKAVGDIANYIFVKEDDSKTNRIIEIVQQFSRAFSKIQKELQGQLDGKYRPYELRATFIDNVYNEGIKDGLPTSVLAEMAGNGVQTARKYYRKASEVQEYAEMFAGVTISGVDIYGNVLEEKDVEELNPVEQGLGGCTQEGCVIDDEQYECLVCPHFATTANRIPLFKEHITRLKKLKESTLNSQERDVIDAQLKLYTAYYLKLLEKIGAESNVADL
ncbi:site-specific integrase [Bacillus mycoides]|uniref:tyrosine-type recombinase/integrase n=1 Tax=Bacillus mycoides TaxID=1405 RepID=UPI00103B3EB1|nr:tyrosine-type recombinase/integrase [Bacillus mycoides]TBX50322.1 site-specific integrase [Bacillus mycoides]